MLALVEVQLPAGHYTRQRAHEEVVAAREPGKRGTLALLRLLFSSLLLAVGQHFLTGGDYTSSKGHLTMSGDIFGWHN